jgi:hypothetical protein
VRLPDFLIGGAPRSGTTWLYRLLERHPDIYMAKPVSPEPKFFLVDSLYEQGLAYYSARWFQSAPSHVLAGEKSTDYLESAAAAARMARDLPRAKLIFVLREPVERAYSNYLWTSMNGFETEDFATALRLEDRRERELPESLKFARPFSYFSRGLYADLLSEYFSRFPREQILVLSFDDLVASPAATAEKLHGFLEVVPRGADADALGVINASQSACGPLDDEIRRTLRSRYAEPNRRLVLMLGPEFAPWLH